MTRFVVDDFVVKSMLYLSERVSTL